MFEIRLICDPQHEPRALEALNGAFELDPPRRYPARDRNRVRLYLTAALKPDANDIVRRIRAEQGPEAACRWAEAHADWEARPEAL